MMAGLRPKLLSIAPHYSFLDQLARWWLEQQGAAPSAFYPPNLANGIFILPTRRAVRGLAEAFLRHSHGKALLLPRIIALGALDETPLALAGALTIAPAVSAPKRLAILSSLILHMKGAFGAPTEADRAWLLAAELAQLLDEAARAEISLADQLPNAVTEDFAAHWNVTLQFLQIVTNAWPAWLQAAGFSDIANYQIDLLNAQATSWAATPPDVPVIAAGTTGAIPSVARLLKIVAHLPKGLVVLPGLDQALDEESWLALDETHPQASLRSLLIALDARRDDVRPWHEFYPGAHPIIAGSREESWRLAMLPAASLRQWQEELALDISGMARLDPTDQQDEATAIALVLREALTQQGARAALVTADRQLARRVAACLLRFGIVADDSAGEPLNEVPAAVFLRLLALAVIEQWRPVTLLALLKHPFCAAGLSPPTWRRAVSHLERFVLRGPSPAPGLAGLRARAGPNPVVERLESCVATLELCMAGPAQPTAAALRALIEAAEALATTDTLSGAARLWEGEDGEALAAHLTILQDALENLPPQSSANLPYLLDAALQGGAVRSRRALRGRTGSEHPRVFIWGLLEARLQSVETIVLGGLAEGIWPRIAESGPWMNRPMRKAVGLPSPEEQIGLSAHDFVMCCCAAPNVILSAPRKRDGAPAVPSRWLVRMDALLTGPGRAPLPLHPAARWAQRLDRPAGAPAPIAPPAPCPPVAWRPRRLTVTEIETLIRDPYAIYARYILRLKKLDPLEQSADAADYGTIVHDGLTRFLVRHGLTWPPDAAEKLCDAMDQALADAAMRPALAAWWRPRLHRIAAWVADKEADRRIDPPTMLCPEKSGNWSLAAPAGDFTLHARADRIERRRDGTIAILDYKTGQPPSNKEAEAGHAPQLPLEGAMVQAGAFGAELMGTVNELIFWQISGGYEPGRIHSLMNGHADKIAALVDLAGENLRRLIAEFDSPHRFYLSQPTPGATPRFSDYALLARVAEWSAAFDYEV